MKNWYCSLRHAWRGLLTVYKTERNFRIHTLIAVLVIIAGFYFQLSQGQWIAILLIIGLVISLEIFNSAVERLVDMLAPRTHHYAKEIKDLMAAVVLVISVLAVLIGLLIFVIK